MTLLAVSLQLIVPDDDVLHNPTAVQETEEMAKKRKTMIEHRNRITCFGTLVDTASIFQKGRSISPIVS